MKWRAPRVSNTIPCAASSGTLKKRLQLFDDGLALGDFASPANLGNGNHLVERFLEEGRQFLPPRGLPGGLPDRPLRNRVRRGGGTVNLSCPVRRIWVTGKLPGY
jgi:hypothetical protein